MSEQDPPKRKGGRGFPPEGRRWPPGQSGNPLGRPKKNKASQPQTRRMRGPGEPTATEQALIEETSRKVKTADGGEVDIVRGAIRSLGVSGIRGNRLANQYIVDRTDRTERRAQEEWRDYQARMLEFRETAFLYHQHYGGLGIDPPAFMPHPDDFVQEDDGVWRIDGPTSAYSKSKWDELLLVVDEARARVFEARDKLLYVCWLLALGRKLKRRERSVAAPFEADLAKATEQFERFNAPLPERYKRAPLPPFDCAAILADRRRNLPPREVHSIDSDKIDYGFVDACD